MDIDIRAELEKYSWIKPRWSTDKLIAASPFRYDHSPSFFVRLEQYGDYPAGTWSDSGAYDDEWRSGNFVKLLSFLRNETYEETEEYLRCEYGWQDEQSETVVIRPVSLRIQRVRQSLNTDILAKYTEDYSYMKKRGISERVQRQMGVLYDTQQKAAVIPWRLANVVLANVKYRKTYGKTFWYAKDAWPIRQLVYGIEKAQATTVICEAEIDAMSWMEVGYAAVAVGGASFNNWKRDILLRSKISELIVCCDNDKAGGKLRKEIETAMRGHVRIRQAYIRADCKDANEALVKYGVDSLRESVEKSEGVSFMYVNLRNRKD
ncbi:toprim domain-containing protein [Neobacillus sp. DY30]|uniref:toprim domain-containing protein n=1 Tax=Neobacillus sp. DY30 TaxID=3047871 RepID=UPI0024BF84DF|nr:toprim domain-containing protein [Neobacillus sp. DY30]WHY01819.1 toprim domain-containing protein [Neobacillus sp. DY30]